ncbi:MAG: hypothetical protein HYX93_04025 [Chloroflexi bacterium]|nr:hypothetical protein [Chloroflexota bacterium]
MTSVNFQVPPEISLEGGNECIHYWVIDVPDGPVSKGLCRLCGETRDFRNYLESASGWDDDRSFSQALIRERYPVSQLVGSVVDAGDFEESE